MIKRPYLGAVIALMACGSKTPPPTTQAPNEPAPTVVASEPGPTPATSASPAPATTAPEVSPQPATRDPSQVKQDLLAAEMSAYDAAKPVFDKFCASCHSKGGPGAKKSTLAHFETTKYPFVGHHMDELGTSVRKTLGVGGSKATMPRNKPGSVQGEDLALIMKWAEAFDASHAGGAHEGEGMEGMNHHGAAK